MKNAISLIPLTVVLSLSVSGTQADELIRLPSSYRQSIEESSRRRVLDPAQPESDHAPDVLVSPIPNRQPAAFTGLASKPQRRQPADEWTSDDEFQRHATMLPQSEQPRDVVTERFRENIEPKQAVYVDAPVAYSSNLIWLYDRRRHRDSDAFAWNDSSTHAFLPQLSVPATAKPLESVPGTDGTYFAGLPPETVPGQSSVSQVSADPGQFAVGRPAKNERLRAASTPSHVVQTAHQSTDSDFSGLLQVLNAQPSGESDTLQKAVQRGLRFPISTWETKDGVVYELDIPGISETGFDVYIEDRVLTISGTREAPTRPGATQLDAMRYGEFRRTFMLSDSLDASTVTAHLENGVLTLRIDRRTEALLRKITVGVQGKSE